MEAQSRHLSELTIRFYRQRLTAIGQILGSTKDIRHITTLDCRTVLMRTSQRSTKHAFVVLRRLFSFLIEEELLTKSPVAKLKAPKIEQKVVDPITAAEIQNCFKVARAARGFMGVRDSVIFACHVVHVERRCRHTYTASHLRVESAGHGAEICKAIHGQDATIYGHVLAGQPAQVDRK
jgi:site-specific recombinase XerC